jgi:hypothetical protein
MKLKVVVVFGNQERQFSIPCGTGNKTIKWLGMVASQRFSNAAPNGTLRRRDDYCGITENCQYQIEHVYLPGGKIAHPGIMIFDSDLKDGDEVVVRLCSKLGVHAASGSPSKTKWSMLAFSTATIDDPYLHSTRSEHIGGYDDESEDTFTLVGTANKAALASIRSKAQFMRIIVHSQMIDYKRLSAKVNSVWSKIEAAVPRLKKDDVTDLKSVLEKNWDMLSDLFEYYAEGSYMTSVKFVSLMDEVELFSEYSTSVECSKIFNRTLSYCGCDDASFDFTCFIVALFLAAQVRFNDTLEAGVEPLSSHEALAEQLHFNFSPLAEKHQLQSVLKYAFASDECLAMIRPMNDELQVVFNRYATKNQDVPTSITVEDLADILVQASLMEEKGSLNKVNTLLQQIHCCTTFGLDPTSPTVENEVSFPEFVEVIARAGFKKYFDPEGDNEEAGGSDAGMSFDGGSQASSSIVGCLVMGVKAVIDKSNTGPTDKQTANAKGRNKKK